MTVLLALRGIGKRFGAVQALDDVTLELRDGEMLGLIGPNGAGKTTLFNVATGFARADSGQVHFAGRRVDALPPDARARAGLVRTFQKATLFPALPVIDNLLLATGQDTAEARRWLAAGSLVARGDTPARSLSHGEQRMLDVLLAMARRPRLLLLDEPTAGLAPDEAAHLLRLLRERGGSVLLITHDLPLAFACDRVAALALGRLLSCGPPAAVRADPAVRAAYLGTLAA